MPVVQLKGLNSLTKTLADGRRVTYWYAWKGGPRLPGRPGSKDFMAAYMAALTDRKMPKASTLAALALRYKASPEFTKNALSTKAEWSRWLDRINDDEIGQLTFRALDDRRVKADLLEWRDQWADRPRSADFQPGVGVRQRPGWRPPRRPAGWCLAAPCTPSQAQHT
jgi:hypothetical protein